jgi:uncharacterized membrane protein
VRRELIVRTSYYEGILPPPEYFAELEKIVPGGAKRVLDSYLKQAVHRQANENKVIESSIHVRALEMKLGAFLSALGITTGGAVAIAGYSGYGVTIVGSTAVVLATSYLRALADQRKQLAEKRAEMDKLAKKPDA